MESSAEDLTREISKMQDEFYSNSGKSIFFKNQQKFDCAKQIYSHISLEILLNQTCRIIPESDRIYIDYPFMKSYATPEIFEIIVEHLFNTLSRSKSEFGKINIHLNLEGFTISAAERYKTIVILFCDKCFRSNSDFIKIVDEFIIYNTPSTIQHIKTIFAPFTIAELHSKAILLSKRESEPILKKLNIA